MIYKYHVSLSVAHSNVPFIYREFRFCLLCLEENPTSHLGYKRNANFVAIYWTNWQLVSHVIGYQENISALVIFLSLTLAPYLEVPFGSSQLWSKSWPSGVFLLLSSLSCSPPYIIDPSCTVGSSAGQAVFCVPSLIDSPEWQIF